jgi:NADPH:quinone reductase-like Zn-dependent oxidoreductase
MNLKAVVQDRYGSADVLEVREIERPLAGDDELLIRVRAAGVDPGVWHLMTGRPYLVRLMGFGLVRPKTRVRGRDVAGVVEAVGRAVNGFAPGDEIYGTCEGSFADYVCAKADKLAPKPKTLSFEQAAAVPISGLSALHALRAGKLEAGQRVLVIGAGGGVGSYTVQLAKAWGGIVTGVCSGSKAALVRSLGASEVIDYTREDVTAKNQRFDLVVDIAGRRPVAVLRQLLTPRGTLVMVGGEGGGPWLGGFERQLLAPVRSLFGEQKLIGLMYEERREDLQTLTELIEAGQIKPVVDKTYALSAAADAIRHLETGHATGKVVLRVA